MSGFVVRMLGGIGGATLSVAMFGGGVAAAADPLVGLTYDKASGMISQWHGDAVVGSVSGSQLELGDCIVTSWKQSLFLDTSGRNSRSREYVLHLNCNNAVASPGHPGNSLSTPQGAAAKKDQQAATNIAKNPSYCEQSDEYLQACKAICERTGLCEV